MGTTNTKRDSMNEIVFENRNKSYGAYAIRIGYDDSLIKSFSITMLVFLALIASFRILQKNETASISIPKNELFKETIVTILPKEHKPEVITRKPTPEAPKSSKPDGPPVVVDSTIIAPKIDTTEKLENRLFAGNGNESSTGTGKSGPAIDTSSSGETGKGSKTVVDFAEIMPEFPGGEKKLLQYLSRNIRFTSMALAANRDGQMVLRFVVDVDGSIKNIEILKKYGYGCEKQAMEVVSGMPKWKPGLMGKRPVAVYFTLPINYKVQHD